MRFIALDPTTAGGSVYSTADVTLTVTKPTLTSLTMSGATAQINKGETKQLSVTAVPEEADATVTWSTSNASVATVGSSSGIVTAVGDGEATITATSTTVNTITATCVVTVITPATFNLVTDLSVLVPGAKVVFGSSKDSSYFVMSGTQGSHNRDDLSATVTSNVMTPGAGYGEFTVGVGTKGGSTIYTFKDSNGYLYAASSGSNYLKSETELDDNGKWTITLTDGVFAITANGDNTRNIMRYNSSSSLFSCYSTGQTAVSLYILSTSPADTAALFASDFVSSFLCDGGENTNVPSTTAWAAMKTRYDALPQSDRTSLEDATANAAGTDLEKRAARYDAVLKAYGTANYPNFMARSYTPQGSFIIDSRNNDNYAWAAIVVGLALVGIATLSIIALKRRHEN